MEQTTDREDEVRDLAYRLWEEAGRPEGRRDEFWYEARQRLASPEDGATKQTQSQSTPPEPADPHPSDENAGNVYNPAPGMRMVSQERSSDLDANPRNRASPA